MKIGASNYDVFPCVVRSGEKTKITVNPCGECAAFENGVRYTVSLLPMEHSEVTYIPNGNISDSRSCYDQITAVPENGIISFEYIFEDEQQWAIDIYPGVSGKAFALFCIFRFRRFI